MANTFTRKLSRGVGTTATQVGGYTVQASTTAVVVGLTIANTSIVTNAPISSGASLVPIGGDQKIVLITGDKIYVQSSAASSIDAILSIMEIT